VPRTVIHYRVAATLPTSAGAQLPNNKPQKRFNYKPNVSKSFEGSLRGTFLKVPLKKELRLVDKSKFEKDHIISIFRRK